METKQVKPLRAYLRWPHMQADEVRGLSLREIGGGFTKHHRAPSIRSACYAIAKPSTLVQRMQNKMKLRGHRNAVYCGMVIPFYEIKLQHVSRKKKKKKKLWKNDTDDVEYFQAFVILLLLFLILMIAIFPLPGEKKPIQQNICIYININIYIYIYNFEVSQKKGKKKVFHKLYFILFLWKFSVIDVRNICILLLLCCYLFSTPRNFW